MLLTCILEETRKSPEVGEAIRLRIAEAKSLALPKTGEDLERLVGLLVSVGSRRSTDPSGTSLTKLHGGLLLAKQVATDLEEDYI